MRRESVGSQMSEAWDLINPRSLFSFTSIKGLSKEGVCLWMKEYGYLCVCVVPLPELLLMKFFCQCVCVCAKKSWMSTSHLFLRAWEVDEAGSCVLPLPLSVLGAGVHPDVRDTPQTQLRLHRPGPHVHVPGSGDGRDAGRLCAQTTTGN